MLSFVVTSIHSVEKWSQVILFTDVSITNVLLFDSSHLIYSISYNTSRETLLVVFHLPKMFKYCFKIIDIGNDFRMFDPESYGTIICFR